MKCLEFSTKGQDFIRLLGIGFYVLIFSREQCIEMKNLTLLGVAVVGIFVGIQTVQAQDTVKVKSYVKKRTLLNQFESDYVLPASKRIALKQSRIAYQYHTKEILDTLDISDRKRKRLIEELKRNPFSERIQEAIANELEVEENSTSSVPD